MKVVVIHNVISPHTIPLFNELAKKVDLKVLYCAAREKNRSWKIRPRKFKYQILKNYQINIGKKDLFTYFINPSIIQSLKKENPDIVVVAGWDLFAYQLAFLYCKIMGIKFVLWSGSTKYEDSWRRRISKPIVKKIVRHSDAYIVYGTRAKDYLKSLGADPGKIFVSFNTTDIEKYRNLSNKFGKNNLKTKKELGLNKEKVLMYYGQLIERKGVDTILKAYLKVREKYNNLALLIVGTGQEKKKLKLLTKELGLEKVIFLEDPGDEDISRYYSVSDLFLLTSKEEVWGLVVNQAMACGLPVIVTNKVGCAPDLIKEGKNGYIINSSNSSQLADRILEIICSDIKTKQFSIRSKEIIKNFKSSEVVNGFERALIYTFSMHEIVYKKKMSDFYLKNRKYFLHMTDTHDEIYFESVLRTMQKINCSLSGKKILDIGCGSGSLIKVLKLKYDCDFYPYGIDISKLGNPEKILNFKLADAEHIPFKNQVFDFVFLVDVLEHLVKPDLVLSEARRVTKKGGQLIIRTPNYLSPIMGVRNYIPIFKKQLCNIVGVNKSFYIRLKPNLSLDILGGDKDAISGIFYNALKGRLSLIGVKTLIFETWGGGPKKSSLIRQLNHLPILKGLGSSITILGKRI